MSEVSGQVHSRFKAFSGALAPDHTLGALAEQAAAWAREARVAPKSIGVEFLESVGKVVLTIGYRDDEPPYEIELRSLPLGKIDGLLEADLARLEEAMVAASRGLDRVICHELYVTAAKDFVMVCMVHKAA